jgi:hypothetical protein
MARWIFLTDVCFTRSLQDDNASKTRFRLVATGKKSLTPEGVSYRFSRDDLMRKRVPSYGFPAPSHSIEQ